MELALLSMPLSCKTLVNQFGNREEIEIPLEESKSTILKFKPVFIISLIITRWYKKKTIIVTDVWFRLFFITFYLLFDGLYQTLHSVFHWVSRHLKLSSWSASQPFFESSSNAPSLMTQRLKERLLSRLHIWYITCTNFYFIWKECLYIWLTRTPWIKKEKTLTSCLSFSFCLGNAVYARGFVSCKKGRY